MSQRDTWSTNPACSVKSGAREDGSHVVLVEVAVLGRERVDARRDDLDARAIEPLPDVGTAREHEGVRTRHIARKEGPPLADGVVRLVDADVRAPDGANVARTQRGDQARGLGIVEDHNVAGAHLLEQCVGVATGDLFVAAPVGIGQRRAFGPHAVKQVVHGLGDLEEVGRAFDHHPPLVDAGAAAVRDQGRKQLGHASALGGRVHVPDHVTFHRRAKA